MDELDKDLDVEGVSVSCWTSEYRLIEFFENCLDSGVVIANSVVFEG